MGCSSGKSVDDRIIKENTNDKMNLEMQKDTNKMNQEMNNANKSMNQGMNTDNNNNNQQKIKAKINYDKDNNKNEQIIKIKINADEVDDVIKIFNGNEDIDEKNIKLFIDNKEIKFYTQIINKEENEINYYIDILKKGIYIIIMKIEERLTNCEYIFCGCNKIIEIEFNNFDTKNVTDMSGRNVLWLFRFNKFKFK